MKKKTAITIGDLKALDILLKNIESWLRKYEKTANKMDIKRKMTGFLGEAIVFRKLNKKHKINAVWKGGIHKGYDIYIENQTKPITISVKTTIYALREKGRGKDKKPDHYEWDVGWSSAEAAKMARENNEKLYFAFVDLRNLNDKPDVFIIPTKKIEEYFFPNGRQAPWKRARYYLYIKDLERYKNNWDSLKLHI
jgi:hypothetical protein